MFYGQINTNCLINYQENFFQKNGLTIRNLWGLKPPKRRNQQVLYSNMHKSLPTSLSSLFSKFLFRDLKSTGSKTSTTKKSASFIVRSERIAPYPLKQNVFFVILTREINFSDSKTPWQQKISNSNRRMHENALSKQLHFLTFLPP